MCGRTSFGSPDAALAHYQRLNASLQAQLAAAEEDIKDFTESSKELQNELEQELERMEKAEKGMRRELELVQSDREDWKVSTPFKAKRNYHRGELVALLIGLTPSRGE